MAVLTSPSSSTGRGADGSSAGGLAQVAQRRGQLAAAAVGVAPLQVGEHGIALEGQGAAEGLDRPVGLVAGQRGVPGGDQPLELPFLADGIPGDDDPDHQGRQPDRNDHQPLHG